MQTLTAQRNLQSGKTICLQAGPARDMLNITYLITSRVCCACAIHSCASDRVHFIGFLLFYKKQPKVLFLLFIRVVLFFAPTHERARAVDLAGNRIPTVDYRKYGLSRVRWLNCDMSNAKSIAKRIDAVNQGIIRIERAGARGAKRGREEEEEEDAGAAEEEEKPEKAGDKRKGRKASSAGKKKANKESVFSTKEASTTLQASAPGSSSGASASASASSASTEASPAATGVMWTVNPADRVGPNPKWKERNKRGTDEIILAHSEPVRIVPAAHVKHPRLEYSLDLTVAAIFLPGKICMGKTSKGKHLYPKARVGRPLSYYFLLYFDVAGGRKGKDVPRVRCVLCLPSQAYPARASRN